MHTTVVRLSCYHFHTTYSFLGGYGRLEADGAFPTALGALTPDAKHSQVIHPNVSTLLLTSVL